MKALLHQPIHETIKPFPEIPRASDVLPRQPQGRTLSWQITFSYPSPPMSSPPSPQKRLIDIPQTTSYISGLNITTTTTTTAPPTTSSLPTNFPYNERTVVSLPPINTGTPATAPTPSQPYSSSFGSTSFPASFTPRLPRASTSSNESQLALVRTDSAASSASTVAEIQPTAGPSTATASSSSGRGGRRSKTHVANACNNCKRAHLSCDVERPCNRCTQTGKADTCRDVPHKKRGRPRLRDEGDFRILQPEAASHGLVSEEAGPSAVSLRGGVSGNRHRRAGSLRTLRSYPDTSSPQVPMAPPQQGLRPTFAPQPQPPPLAPGLVTPTAFLDLDLVILKANPAFQNLVGHREIRGLRLASIATPREGDSFQTARNSLRAEREAKEPAYLPPIFQPGIDPVQGISLTDQDIDEVTRGFVDQHYTWTFRLSGGIDRTLPVRVRLAKTSVYFVTLFLPPLAEPQIEQSAPGPAQQTYRPQQVPLPPQQAFHSSPIRQFAEPSFTGREGMMQTIPQASFHQLQQVYEVQRAPPPGAAPMPLSRSYPPYEIQPRYYSYAQSPTQLQQPHQGLHQQQPQQQQQYQQQPSLFQPAYPPPPLHTIHERQLSSGSAPTSAGSAQSPFIPPSPYLQSYPSTATRPRSATLESLGRHVQTRLRADSGVTPSAAVQSSPLHGPSGQQHQRESSEESGEVEGAPHRPSPRKRRRMDLGDVLHQH